MVGSPRKGRGGGAHIEGLATARRLRSSPGWRPASRWGPPGLATQSKGLAPLELPQKSVSKMAINLGNLIAGILIFIIALIAVCAGLGWYSRR